MVLFFYNKQYKNEIFAGYSHLYDPLTGRWPFLAGPERSYGACVDLLVEEFIAQHNCWRLTAAATTRYPESCVRGVTIIHKQTLWMLKISAFFCVIFYPCPLAAGAFFVV